MEISPIFLGVYFRRFGNLRLETLVLRGIFGVLREFWLVDVIAFSCRNYKDVFSMRSSFFREMRRIDEAAQRDDLRDDQLAVFHTVIDFVEDARFTKSPVTTFICRNWRYNAEDLRKIWEQETGKSKHSSTFRSQVSDVSVALYELLPEFSVELFTSEEYDAAKLDKIVKMIDVVGVSDRSIDRLFLSDVLTYPDSMRTDSKFTIEELDDTIARLRPYLRTNMLKSLDSIDIEKLVYVLVTLKKPLCMTHGEGLCRQKLEILQKLGVTDSVTTVEEEKPVREVQVPKVIHVQEKPRYNFSDWKSLCNCISDFAETPDTAIHMGYDADSAEFKAAVKRVRNILSVYSVEGLKSQLAKCWTLAVKLVLKEYERV